jgi:signal transduction histidine kinase
MAEIRSLMYGLEKDDLNWHAIVGELKEQSAKLLGPHQIGFSMTTDFDDDIPNPSSYMCLQLFRIYREAILNVIKQAKATKVSVNLWSSGNLLFLEIYDNGQGFNTTTRSTAGRGIGNMKKRAEALNGKTTISGNAGKRVTIEIPLQLQPLLG